MTPQVFIYDERFVLLGIADLVALGCGTLIEFDGRAKYGIGGQDVRTQLINEKMRGDRLGDLGYELARLMWGTSPTSGQSPGAGSARSSSDETATARLLPAPGASARSSRTGWTIRSPLVRTPMRVDSGRCASYTVSIALNDRVYAIISVAGGGWLGTRSPGMAVRISHTTFDARNAYEQSVWWGELLGFAEDPDDPNLPGHRRT